MKILETPTGLTIRELREWIKSVPDTDESGDERDVWVETGQGFSSVVTRVIPLNVCSNSCDILFVSNAFIPGDT